MTLDHDEIADVLTKLASKIGIGFEEKVTMAELVKKVANQNLCYQTEAKEINLLEPSFKNAFFIKNVSLELDEEIEIDKEAIVGIKMINKKNIILKDLNGKKTRVKYDGDNVRFKIKEIPVDLYFKLINNQ